MNIRISVVDVCGWTNVIAYVYDNVRLSQIKTEHSSPYDAYRTFDLNDELVFLHIAGMIFMNNNMTNIHQRQICIHFS